MEDSLTQQNLKRNVAYKLRIGDVYSGKQFIENEKLRCIEIMDKKVTRINIIANIVDKYIQEGEKRYGVITVDDATGQIKIKLFGEDVEKFSELNQGDTILVVGLLRVWNNEVYVTPEIMKKRDPAYLLVRKFEIESEQLKTIDKSKIAELKDRIVGMIKEAEKEGGINVDKIIMELKEPPEIINQEIKKLLEDGFAYEPRPGKLRYLG